MLAAEQLRGFSIRSQFCETRPTAKADNKNMIFTAAVSTFLLLAFANGHISQNGFQIRNRRNFMQLTHILFTKIMEYCECSLVLNECGLREYDVLLCLAGAEVHYNFAEESRGSLPGANTITLSNERNGMSECD